MSNYNLDISRRKLLGAMGTIGGAAALGGAGTMAFFSDEEEFANNELVAGELDLKVDWQEHYSDWSIDENDEDTNGIDDGVDDPDRDDDGVDDFDVVMTGGDPSQVPNGYYGLPTPLEPLIAIPQENVGDFMRNTMIEAFPDEDGDGMQDTIQTRDQISSNGFLMPDAEVEREFRAQFADLPDDLDSDRRTESSRGDPLIDLQDVKPGDFGEITFSFHLFNNPGYIWLDGELVENAENGHTDPESTDPDEDDDPNDTVGELPKEIRVAVWHDNGDNLLIPAGGTELVHSPHDVDGETSIELEQDEAIITQGTLEEFLDDLADGGIQLDADTRDAERDCYDNSTTRHVCLAWWLPVDHANEIQGDSVAFDLGFYTEQCRHNDGTGNAPSNDDT